MATGDDRLHVLTRLTFAPLVLFTGIFGPMLIILADATEDFWAWTIRPDMSAVWVGSGYTFGSIALATMLIVGRWKSAIVPVVSTFPFAVVMLTATLIHNDRFFTDSIGYYLWLAIYVALPVLLPIAFMVNRAADPGPGDDLLLPPNLRLAMIVAGLVAAALGAVLVVEPDAIRDSWPWQLSPLMARVVGGWLLFIAAGGLSAIFETRYLAYRYYIPEAALWFVILLSGSLANLSDFDSERPATTLYFGVVPVIIVTLCGVFLLMERKISFQRRLPN